MLELKSLQDWAIRKQSKTILNLVEVSPFGGLTKEYQVRLDPDKLVSYGLSLSQIEQQLANNNVNAGGNFVEVGLQQFNVRAVGLIRNVGDIRKIVVKTQNGTPLRMGDIATLALDIALRSELLRCEY